MGENFILGKSPLNIDGPEKLTGRAKYVIDMVMPGMVHGKVLRSPHPHAKIINIDTSKAKALTGVCAIVTGDDVPLPTTLSWRVTAAPSVTTSLSPCPTFVGSVAPPANVTTLLPREIDAFPVEYRIPASVPMDR